MGSLGTGKRWAWLEYRVLGNREQSSVAAILPRTQYITVLGMSLCWSSFILA